MAALRITDVDIIFSSCGFFLLFFYLLFSSPISAVADWMSTILPHKGWPWCEFRMQVWNVLHAALWNTGRKNNRQKSPSGHHRTNLSGYIFATQACIDNRKKLVKQQYLLHVSHSMVNFGPLTTTSSSAIAEGPRDTLSQLKSCELLYNCTKNHIWLQGLPFHVV